MSGVKWEELVEGSKTAVNVCMGVKPQEQVVIITDFGKLRIADALAMASIEAGGIVSVFIVTPSIREKEVYNRSPPELMLHSLRGADVIFTPLKKHHPETPFRQTIMSLAKSFPCRIGHMPGITEEIMKSAMTADYGKIRNIAEILALTLAKTKRIQVTSQLGTDVTFELGGWSRPPEADTGILTEPYSVGNLPAGEVFVAPIEETAKGKLYVDGSIPDMKVNPNDPVIIAIKNGHAVSFEPHDHSISNELRSLAKSAKNGDVLGEFGIGLNEKAQQFLGIAVHDEKIYGTAHLALGDNTVFKGKNASDIHLDLVIRRPTIKFDEEILMEEGNLLLDKLALPESYESYDALGMSRETVVRRSKNAQCLINKRGLIFRWKGGLGLTHHTQVGDHDTSRIAAKVWDQLSAWVDTNVEEIGKKTGYDRELIIKTLKVMDRYDIVQIL